jgi:hypothetical protein
MPHISKRYQKLEELSESKEDLFAEWLILKQKIALHDYPDDNNSCPLLDSKKIRFCHLNLLLMQKRGKEREIVSTRFLRWPLF